MTGESSLWPDTLTLWSRSRVPSRCLGKTTKSSNTLRFQRGQAALSCPWARRPQCPVAWSPCQPTGPLTRPKQRHPPALSTSLAPASQRWDSARSRRLDLHHAGLHVSCASESCLKPVVADPHSVLLELEVRNEVHAWHHGRDDAVDSFAALVRVATRWMRAASCAGVCEGGAASDGAARGRALSPGPGAAGRDGATHPTPSPAPASAPAPAMFAGAAAHAESFRASAGFNSFSGGWWTRRPSCPLRTWSTAWLA